MLMHINNLVQLIASGLSSHLSLTKLTVKDQVIHLCLTFINLSLICTAILNTQGLAGEKRNIVA